MLGDRDTARIKEDVRLCSLEYKGIEIPVVVVELLGEDGGGWGVKIATDATEIFSEKRKIFFISPTPAAEVMSKASRMKYLR